ncbi:MAG: BatA domain-containing protein [Planctomycetota bacterium]
MLIAPLAFGFANLAMLGWLAAAAAPILIHLWMRQTHRETAWAAIRFLQAALERQARRLRLQHWILLTVRTLLLVCVALAAAKPLLDSGFLSGGVPTHRVLVIDASLSMSAVDADGETALARAKRMAGALIDAARVGDTHSVVVMGTDAGTPLGRPTSDASSARRAVDGVAPTQGVADLPVALAHAQRLIDAANESTTGRRHEVLFFSDLAANTWAGLGKEEATGSLAEAYELLVATAEVSAFDVGGSTLPNAAVTSLVLSDGLPTLAAPVEVRGEIELFEAKAGEASERLVELLIDDVPVAEQRVQLTAGQATPVNFYHGFDVPGPRAVTLRLADANSESDRLITDNRRHVAVNLRQRIRVLCVAGSPGAADYLADALDPVGDGIFEPVLVTDADLPTVELPEYARLSL